MPRDGAAGCPYRPGQPAIGPAPCRSGDQTDRPRPGTTPRCHQTLWLLPDPAARVLRGGGPHRLAAEMSQPAEYIASDPAQLFSRLAQFDSGIEVEFLIGQDGIEIEARTGLDLNGWRFRILHCHGRFIGGLHDPDANDEAGNTACDKALNMGTVQRRRRVIGLRAGFTASGRGPSGRRFAGL